MSEEASLDDFMDTTSSFRSDTQNDPWSKHQLSEATMQIQAGGTPSTDKSEYYNGTIPWVKTGELKQPEINSTEQTITEQGLEESTARLFSPQTVLIAMYGATTGEVSMLNMEAATNQACCGIVPNEGLNPNYLYQYLAYKNSYLVSLSAGSGQQNISKSILEKFKIPIPPIYEQRKIATVLYTVDQAIQKTEEIIEQATRVRKGLMQDLFRYGLDEDGELRGSAGGSEPYRETKYGEIPESWDIVPLGQLVPEDAPIVYGILKPGDHQPDGVPVVKVKDIHDGEVKQGDILHTSHEIHEDFKRAELREGDLLFTIRGTVGRMAFVPERLDGGNITQDTARIRVTEANSRFIRYFFETETPNNYFERNTIGQAVQGINLEDLREVPVHLPSEEEQARIVEIIDQHSETLRNERDYLQRLQRFKQGLMQDLLSGAVRTYDMDIDIPESVLAHD